MGRVKELLLEKEEQDWLQEEQEKILNDKHREISIMYADLLDFKSIKKSERVYIDMINGKTYDFCEKDVIELNALCIKIDYGMQQHIVLPLDKVVSVKYIY